MNKRFARVSEITSTKGKPGRYPVSPATWWRWVSTGYAPAGKRLGPNVTAWEVDQLDAFDHRVSQGAN